MSEEEKPLDAPSTTTPVKKKRGPGRAAKLGEKIEDVEHLAAKARARYDRENQRHYAKRISAQGGKTLSVVKVDIRKKMLIDLVADKSLPLKDALVVAGVSHDSYRNWTQTDETFARDMAYAELKLQIELVECIKKASHTDWKAASYLLNHFPTYKGSFMDPSKVPSSVPAVNIQVNNVETQKNAVLTLIHQLNPSLAISDTLVLDIAVDGTKGPSNDSND